MLSERVKLIVSLLIDAIGMVSYYIPFIGELADIFWSFVAAAWIKYAYGTTKGAVFGFVEELLPFTDFIPTCTIVHFMTRKKRLS